MSGGDLQVHLDPPYPVCIRESFAEVIDLLHDAHGDRRWFVLADSRVLHENPSVRQLLVAASRTDIVQVQGGERIKSLKTLEKLVAAALEARVDRRSLLVAVGGGTVGDLGGYFAASYMRGIDWCPVATTVVSLADSAVGGKTGVNSNGLKNLVGAFHQPVGVYGALEALRTLPLRHRRSGLAEVVKSAVIADADLFAKLEREWGSLAQLNLPQWGEMLLRAAAVKAEIVAEDPREAGRRELLNFGHTIGHAIEATARPRLYHGEAVSLGMNAATFLSEVRHIAPQGTRDRLQGLLGALDLPLRRAGLDLESALEAVGYDKKVWDRRVRMVLTEGIGSATVGHEVDWSELSQALQSIAA